MCVRRPPAVCLCSLAIYMYRILPQSLYAARSVSSTFIPLQATILYLIYLILFVLLCRLLLLFRLLFHLGQILSICMLLFLSFRYFVRFYFRRLVTLYITVSVVKLLCRLLFPSLSYFVHCYFRRSAIM